MLPQNIKELYTNISLILWSSNSSVSDEIIINREGGLLIYLLLPISTMHFYRANTKHLLDPLVIKQVVQHLDIFLQKKRIPFLL